MEKLTYSGQLDAAELDIDMRQSPGQWLVISLFRDLTTGHVLDIVLSPNLRASSLFFRDSPTETSHSLAKISNKIVLDGIIPDLMEGETTMVVGGHRSRRKWRTTKEILDLQRPYLPIGFAVFLDLLFLYIPIINEDMKCLGLDTYRLSYSTWSILVFFFHSTRDAACLEYANPVLLTVTTISSEISHFYMVPMLQNMDQQTSVGSNF